MAGNEIKERIPPCVEDELHKKIDSLNEALGRQIHEVALKNERIQELKYDLQQNVQEIKDKYIEIDSLRSRLHTEEARASEQDQTITELKFRVKTLANSLRATISAIEGQ